MVGAEAYTVGHHVVFAQDAYVPGSSRGRELIAHELAHVVQQQGAEAGTPLTIGKPESAAEREAEAFGRIVASGGRVSALQPVAAVLQRAQSHPDSRFDKKTWRGNAQQPDVEISIEYVGNRPGMPANWYEGKVKSEKGQGSFSGAVSGDKLVGTFSIFLANNGGRRSGSATMNLKGVQLEPVFSYTPLGNIMLMSPAASAGPPPPPPPAPKEPEAVCGPNVTLALDATLRKIEADVRSWPMNTVAVRCNYIVDGPGAVNSWDISGLVERPFWADALKQGCSQPTNPQKHPKGCQWGVQIGNVCQDVYSPNYAMFGTACRMCNQRLSTEGDPNVFRQSAWGMYATQGMYKLLKYFTGRYHTSIDANQMEWAEMGFQGWTRSSKMPTRSDYECKPTCKMSLPAVALPYVWKPDTVPDAIDPFYYRNGTGTGLNTGQTIDFKTLPNKTASGATHEGTITTVNHFPLRAVFIGTVKGGIFEGRIEVFRQGRSFRGTVRFLVSGDKLIGSVEPAPLMNLFKLSANSSGGQLTFNMKAGAASR
jgi:hypothetical protein